MGEGQQRQVDITALAQKETVIQLFKEEIEALQNSKGEGNLESDKQGKDLEK